MMGHSRAFSALARVMHREGARFDARLREGAPDLLDHEVNAILDNTVGPTSYVRDDAWREEVLRDFRANLGAIADVAEDAGAQWLCVVPASNLLDCSPFKSGFQSGLGDGERERCEALLATAEKARRLERPEEAINLLDQALAIENRYGHLHYARGRALYDAGRYPEAREALERARDEDICPLRASGTIQKIVAEMAKGRESLCVDFDTVIRQRSPHGIPDATFFPDHVHLTVEGNGILAGAIVESLIEAGIVNPSASWGDGAIAQVARDIESRLDRQAQGRALHNLSRVMAWAGKTEEALSLALRALEFSGADTQMLCHAGALARMQGDLEGAAAPLEKALGLAPDDARVHTEMGLLLKDQAIESGDRDLLNQAGWHFRRSVDLAPDDGRSQGNLANTLAMTGHPEAARHHFEEAIRLSPSLVEVRVSYGFFLMHRGEREAAIEQLQQALKLDPRHTRAEHYLAEARSTGER
jgi:tetratricopeptide (TPR) repeat protein